MAIGEIRTRYRVYRKTTGEWLTKSDSMPWTKGRANAPRFVTQGEAYERALRFGGAEFEEDGTVVIVRVQTRRVPSKTSRDLARVTKELAAANAANDRLAAALRRAITQEIPQEEKANFMREALGQKARDDRP